MSNVMEGGFLRDAATGALIISGGTGGSSGGGVGVAAPSELKRKLWLPTGVTTPSAAAAGDVIDESCARTNGAQTVTLASGVAYLVGRMVAPAGRPVDSVSFMTGGSGASGITGYFFAVVRRDDLAVMAKSADESSAWGGSTLKTLLMTTPWIPQEDTPVYALICMVASGMPSLSAEAAHIQSINRAPVMAGSSTSGLTNAASLGATVAAPVQAGAGVPYASINSLTAAPAADVSEGLDTTMSVGTVSTTSTKILKPAQFPIKVQGLSLVLDNTAIAASDTDFWKVELGKLAALTGTFGSIMATKTSQATGGAAFLTNQAWTFDAVPFTAANQTLSKDDVLAIRFTKNGTVANLQGLVASARYQIA